ncbi:soluble lytic murein transglycosylase-like protein [Rhodococcus sp. PvR044]|uniref:transglycosylase SLT domain-containing protein n=1 Tax=Rhodococcus sp. PvR044 TaxID=3156402 RepID=UPI0033919AA5
MFALSIRRAALAMATAAAGTAALLAAPVAAGASALDRVPADFAPWIRAAPATCAAPQITPELVAAQIEFESGFDARAVGPLGQAGPAQLLPDHSGDLRDDDGSGAASPFDIGDAVHALVRIDCRLVDQLAAAGKSIDPETIAAAYSAGVGGIDQPIAREYARAVTEGL